MAEIMRSPEIAERDGVEFVTFNEDHTLSDFIRYLLTQTDRDELRYLVEHVEQPQ